MLNSKDLLERTGISRATLNNYIALGIVPKPVVLPPEPHDGAAPRIGYFPEDTVARIADIQRLKNEGWSMAAIAEHFGSGRAGAPRPEAPASAAPTPVAPADRLPAGPAARDTEAPCVSLDEITQPAYLVDRSFRLRWANAASAAVLGQPDAAEHVLAALLQQLAAAPGSREEVLRFHLAIARQQGLTWSRLAVGIPASEQQPLRSLYEDATAMPADAVAHVLIPGEAAAAGACIYAVQFAEGILFVHVPVGAGSTDLSSLLGPAAPSAGHVPRRRRPVLSDVAVVAFDLHDAARIWSALPAEEYFELIDQIWTTAQPIVRRHHGMNGKHPGDGMVCYFLPQRDTRYVWNAVQAAHEMRDAMRHVSKQWQLRKGWTTELYLNTGLDEGQQWLGTLRSAGQVEFTMFGDTLNRATHISEFARFGAVWATKNLVVKLAPEDRHRLKYGIHRRDKDGRHAFVSSVFTTVDRIGGPAGDPGARLQDIARLPITEIVDIAGSAPHRAAPFEPSPN